LADSIVDQEGEDDDYPTSMDLKIVNRNHNSDQEIKQQEEDEDQMEESILSLLLVIGTKSERNIFISFLLFCRWVHDYIISIN